MADIIEFKDGQLVSNGYVEIDGVQHEVHEAVYEGETPISSYMLNKMQKNLFLNEYRLPVSQAIADNSEITIPCNYKVGNDSLMVIFNGEVLLKATDTLDGHYKEVGITGSISNKIKIHQWGCSVEPGDVFKFLVRGDYDVNAE